MALHISWDNESSSVFVDLVVAQPQEGTTCGEKWIFKGDFEQPSVTSTPVFLLDVTRKYTQGRTCLLENWLKMLQGFLGGKKIALGPKWNILKTKELLTIRKKLIILPD